MAVIVILAVVALVATPIIMTSVKNAKMSAANSSALGYIDGINKSLELNAFEGKYIEDGVYTVEELKNKISDYVKIQGNYPDIGKVYIKDNSVLNANLVIDTYNTVYDGTKSEVTGTVSDFNSETKIYKEDLLHGTDPIYGSNLIPVTIEDNGTVKKANITSEWYKYESKRWANAVILKEDKTGKYNDKPYGTVIDSNDIESYFVWIPKYSYQIFNLDTSYSNGEPEEYGSNKKTIQITFGTTNTSDDNTGECTTPMLSGEIGECAVGKTMTHPSFISMNTNGFWVAKFETTGSTTNLSVLPGETSLRNQTIKTMFELAYNYKRHNDSHMMKNTEWGAVAYLSHSKYGLKDQVRVNNYINGSERRTGYSAVTEPICYTGSNNRSDCNQFGSTDTITKPYNTETGYLASTTGNISGIYDMSGGVHEYMASYNNSESAYLYFDENSLSKYEDKYFDKYTTSTSVTAYNRMILGDATGEMGPFYKYIDSDNSNRYHNNWYADNSYLGYYDKPWFNRGGGCCDGVLAGQFFSSRDTGVNSGGIGFRLVLTN